MTRPAGRAAIEIVGDASKLADSIKRAVDNALRDLKLDTQPLTERIAESFEDAAGRAREAFDSLGDDARRELDPIGDQADDAADTVARAFQRGGERAEDAFREMGRVAGREFAAIAVKAKVAGRSVDNDFGKKLKSVAGDVVGTLKTLVSGVSLVAAAGSLLGPLTISLLGVGKAIGEVGQALSATAPLAAFLPSLAGSLALVVGTLKLAGPGLAEAMDPVVRKFIDLDGNATAVLQTIRDLASRGLKPLAQAFADLHLNFIIAAMDQIAMSTNTAIVSTANWLLSASGLALVRDISRATADSFALLAPKVSAAVIALGELALRAGDRAIVAFGELLGRIVDKFTEWADSKSIDDINAGLDKFKAGWIQARVAFDHVRAIVTWVVDHQAEIQSFSTALGVFAVIGGAATGNWPAALIGGMSLLLIHWKQVVDAFSGDAIDEAMPGIRAALGEVVSAFTAILPDLAQFGADVLRAAVAFGPLVSAMAPVSSVLLDVAGEIAKLAAALAPLVTSLVEVATPILALLVPALQLVTAVVTPLVPAVAALADVVGTVLGAAAKAVAVPLGLLADLLGSNPELVWVMVAAFTAWWVATNLITVAINAVVVVMYVIRAATIAWTAAQWLLDIALNANPIGLVVIAIAALVGLVILAWKHSDTFRAVVIALWHALEAAGRAIASWFSSALREVGEFFSGVGSWFANLGPNIASGVSTALDAVGGFVAGIGRWFSNLGSSIGRGFTAALSAVGRAIAALPGLIARGIEALPGLLWKALVGGLDLVLKGIGIVIGLILAVIIGSIKVIWFSFTELPVIIGDAFAKGWAWAAEATVKGAVAVLQWAIELPDKIRLALGTLAVFIGGLFADAWNWAWRATVDGGAKVLQWAVELPDKIKLAIGTLAVWIGTYFADLWDRAWRATVDGGAKVLLWVVELPDKIKFAIGSLAVWLGKFFSDLWTNALRLTAEGIQFIIATVVSLPENLAKLGPRLADVGRGLITAFLNGLKAVGGFFSDVGSAILGGLKSGLNYVINRINSGIASIDDKLPFGLPRIPQLATGGLTTGEGLANLHPKELVLPLEDSRAVDLLAKALAEADAGLRATGVKTDEPSEDAELPEFHIYIGDKEITDMIDVRIVESNRSLRRRVQAGAGRL